MNDDGVVNVDVEYHYCGALKLTSSSSSFDIRSKYEYTAPCGAPSSSIPTARRTTSSSSGWPTAPTVGPVDDDVRARQLLNEFARPTVLADDPALLALEVVVVAGVLRQVDQIERPEVVIEDRQRRLRFEPRPIALIMSGATNAATGSSSSSMATLPDSESMSSRTFARSSISHRLAAGADDDADTVCGTVTCCIWVNTRRSLLNVFRRERCVAV